MSWYKTGLISLTNGSKTVVGNATNFTKYVEVGEALLAPDGQHYEIATVVSSTELHLAKAYAGPTAANQGYTIVPVQGYVRELAHKAADLIDAHKGVPAEALSHAEAAAQSAAEAQAANIGVKEARDAAAESAASAAASATAAAGTVSQVADLASQIQTSATAASGSATSASSSKTAAEAAATSATASATTARTAANEAVTSNQSAGASAAAAGNSATQSQTSATAAANSSAQALTRANAAGASATLAEQSSQAAQAFKAAAAASEASAQAAKTAAELSKTAAASSAVESAASAAAALASKAAAAAVVNTVNEARDAALAHTATAKAWADKVDGEVEPGKYSARYWAKITAGAAAGGGGPTLQGDTSPYANQTKTYQITNYNSFSSYAVSASAGTASISGDTITYTAPATAGSVDLTLTVDGQPAVFVINVQAVPSYIPTPTPTPTNFGDPLEGGFYAGMVWGQIAQSSTSMAIATGGKTLTVADMSSAPIVYAGQMVEVRSRANPANKFVGTVTGALGTSLTINVTSIGGSGTFSDWSVMARHRVIVAPKASGEHAGIALKNANSALPTACQTLTEGFAATQAMRDADSSTVYPAAHWARNLNIGGRTDWYIPARDELELCWRNLKPVTDNNYAAANRFTGPGFNYANNGSYGNTAATHGTNNNSSPTGAAYTTTVPAQTTATAFRTGGAEAFEFGSSHYWSSSDYNATSAWFQYWLSSFPGNQSGYGKGSSVPRVRAVRRSII